LDKSSKKKIISIAIGPGKSSHFQNKLKDYGVKDRIQISKNATEAEFSNLLLKIKAYDLAIISIHATSKYPPKYGITYNCSQFVQKANQVSKTLLVDFGNPYNLQKFPNQDHLLLAYVDEPLYQEKAAHAIFGLTPVRGTLPIGVGSYKRGSGRKTAPSSVLNHARPDEVGMTPTIIGEIDRLTERAVRIGATPGAQVLVAKGGKVIFQRSFGKHTYARSKAVENDHLYDLASITKVAATTLTLMKLTEQGKLSLDEHMSTYMPELIGSNKSTLRIREVLQHKAGLKAWIPFYQETTSDKRIYDSIYSSHPTSRHNVYLGNSLYMLDGYKDHIIEQIIDSDIEKRGRYKYSDLGMILMKELIERVTQQAFDEYVQETFYRPLGLTHLTFLPLNRFAKDKIIPTALSPDMRKGVVQGHVHDPAAAMLGGVSGHAGLFGNAESLAVLMQMLLNGGVFNGQRILEEETILLFTKQQTKDSRRGLGWDKPEFKRSYRNPASDYASHACFGHTGFTGTMVWADPKYDLIYIFLSNRVYPTQENKKLIREGVRTDIMDAIYKSFLEG
jgi:CubicO group peptidase (beta-lactamase class C family)